MLKLSTEFLCVSARLSRVRLSDGETSLFRERKWRECFLWNSKSRPSYELRYYRNIWSYVYWNFTAEIPADVDLDSADDLKNLRPPSQVGAQFPLCI